jgi:hypothetical protein
MQSTKNYNSNTPPTTTMTTAPTTPPIDGNFLQKEVTSKVNSAEFCREHYNNRAPLAMVALAGIVVDTIIRPNHGALIPDHFSGLTMTVPAATTHPDPHYHSITGQQLLLVDWKRMFAYWKCLAHAALKHH